MDNDNQRFESKYKIDADGCWRWQGALDKDGYGSFYYKQFNRRAHRYSYWLANGSIPEGMVIDHVCRNKDCVNPQHLRAVTPRQNSLENSDSVCAKNAEKTVCSKGHPYDRVYFNKKRGVSQRICSICHKNKQRRLRKKWREENKDLRSIC